MGDITVQGEHSRFEEQIPQPQHLYRSLYCTTTRMRPNKLKIGRNRL